MKLGEVVAHMGTTNFIEIRWKTKKFYYLIAHLMDVSSVKVPLRGR